MTVSLAGRGAGLGTMWSRQRADEYLRAAGFTEISVHQLDHDVRNDYWGGAAVAGEPEGRVTSGADL